LNTSRDGDSTTSLGSLCQYHSFGKEIFPNIQSKLPLTQLEAVRRKEKEKRKEAVRRKLILAEMRERWVVLV